MTSDSFPEDLGVIACKHVLDDGKPVEVVFHDPDGDWDFLCGGDHSSLPHTEFEIVCVWHLIERQPELARLVTLDPDCLAEPDEDGRWVRSPVQTQATIAGDFE